MKDGWETFCFVTSSFDKNIIIDSEFIGFVFYIHWQYQHSLNAIFNSSQFEISKSWVKSSWGFLKFMNLSEFINSFNSQHFDFKKYSF